MQLSNMTYARTFNLGNFENERIEITADMAPGDEFQSVLSSLRNLVEAGRLNPTTTSPALPEQNIVNALVLFNFAGHPIKTFNTEHDWLKAFDNGVSRTQDISGFIGHNRPVLEHIKLVAKKRDNPRALNMVTEIETRAYKALGA